MAARSSHWRISGCSRSGEQAPRPRLAVQGGQQHEDHARRRQIALPELSPGRFGLTTARHCGGSSRIMWWSMTTTFRPMALAWATASLAAAPQSTVMTRSAPEAFRVSKAFALGP
jgi:hypothetical protein